MKVTRFKAIVLFILSLTSFCVGTVAFAAASGATGVGGIATTVMGNLSSVAKLITAGSYVAGMGFAVAAIVKFKAHKEQSTQIPISTPIVFLFVAAALLFAPSVFKSSGQTLFGSSGVVGGISGTVSFT